MIEVREVRIEKSFFNLMSFVLGCYNMGRQGLKVFLSPPNPPQPSLPPMLQAHVPPSVVFPNVIIMCVCIYTDINQYYGSSQTLTIETLHVCWNLYHPPTHTMYVLAGV